MLNSLIAIDKPACMTSHDVVAKLRGILKQKRIGHAGTLDPFATGVLVVGLGQATKLLECLAGENKVYVATFAFGKETTTDDIEGEIIFQSPLSTEDRERLTAPSLAEKKLDEMKGWTEQLPPSFSAVSVEGMRSYKRARQGTKEEVEATLSPRSITIYQADLLDIEGAEVGVAGVAGERGDTSDAGEVYWTVRLDVSKGTYIRALARDLGRMLGCGAYVKTLRRESAGAVNLADCITIEELQTIKDAFVHENSAYENSAYESALSADEVTDEVTKERTVARFLAKHALNTYDVLNMPFRYVTELDLRKARVGESLYNTDAISAGKLIKPQPGDDVALYNEEGLWGLWKVKDPLSLICDKNFPEPIAGVEVPYGF